MDEAESPDSIAGGVPNLEEPLRRAIALAAALREIHRRGEVCGRLDLRDLVWEADGVKWAAGGGAGPAPYPAPEQARGEPPDALSDIFAFGAMAYELFSGRRVFDAEDAPERTRQILQQTTVPLPGVPPRIAAIFNRCLEKQREHRWQRIHYVLIELKLARAAYRQEQSSAEWKEKMSFLRSQIAVHDRRFAAQQAARDVADAQLRRSDQELEERLYCQETEITRIRQMLEAIHQSIQALLSAEEVRLKAIQSLEAAAAQAGDIAGHIVEAFDQGHGP